MNHSKEIKDVFPNLPERIIGLGELSYNLWWSWHPAARMLFKMIDRPAWKESVHNPVRMLREIPRKILESAANNPDFLQHYDTLLSRFHNELKAKSCWFTENVAAAECLPVAYFSAEYGLHHSLPFYAGGLGFLAGDHLKECSDLGIPVTAVGFMYPEGYLRQKIRVDGWQEHADEVLDRDAAPIERVFNKEGQQLIVKVPFIDPPVHVAVWKVSVGNVPLYLMDTDIELNDPWNRLISARLYTGDIEQRLRQEIVLGIGGREILDTLGIRHSVLHLNEGHPAFALLEKVRERMEDGLSFEDAAGQVRATTVFTTHTPVPAGHDVFPFHLMDKYFSSYYPMLGLDRDAFLQMGIHPEKPAEGFNMTAFALRMSGYHNGVSKKHGEVARKMWQPLWPELKEEDVPIDSITNGIHVPTWIEPKMELLFNKYLGQDWLKDHDNPGIWKSVDDIPDKELWQAYIWVKIKLVNFIRERTRKRWVEDRTSPLNVVAGGTLLDPMTLTIGFARRFASYKRADLIFHDLERLKKLLNNRWRPLQIIFAGKAHPADDDGKRILQRIFNFADNPDFGGRIAFVENYDEQLAQYMVHGVDLWLNNPVPPMEASGTSGMKAALNGVPHLSILDGWWIEGYNGKNGWAFEGNGDKSDAESIYNLLEQKIIPLYYNLDDNGMPHNWVKIMKEAIKNTGAGFSARRMVKEYVAKFYHKALKSVV
ncbi:MAG TPA: alpha-glucan family phosphorylase [Nitrospirae bacterium]|nr:glycogen phosphorylase [bacterium BMS3Abin06]HDH12283.1 alpha-glucan family phosphorylase [Nitrospirota bacterium]HDZ02326.1 alpha-glucan family phosphorylase [Nitrospirota bacterium]